MALTVSVTSRDPRPPAIVGLLALATTPFAYRMAVRNIGDWAAATKASWIRIFSEREGISLSDSFAYSDSMSDLPMLSIVGHPAAVNPDMRLRQTALHHDWPILNLK